MCKQPTHSSPFSRLKTSVSPQAKLQDCVCVCVCVCVYICTCMCVHACGFSYLVLGTNIEFKIFYYTLGLGWTLDIAEKSVPLIHVDLNQISIRDIILFFCLLVSHFRASGLVFIFGTLIMLITALTFVIGGPVDRLMCDPLLSGELFTQVSAYMSMEGQLGHNFCLGGVGEESLSHLCYPYHAESHGHITMAAVWLINSIHMLSY